MSAGNITLPAGASDHGNPNLLCLPAKWSDILIFFLGNYVAHAATLRSLPGASIYETAVRTYGALIFPVSGIAVGMGGILSLANLAKTDLEVAARAGALCKVVRSEYRQTPREKYISRGLPKSAFAPKFHGRVVLPDGYGLAIVGPKSKFVDNDIGDPAAAIALSYNLNAITILIAIGQLAFSVTTLYRTKGDQINRYGYAAFGLTVTQYALMSLMNLLGNLICPQFPTMYVVKSEEMENALSHPEAVFEGHIGELLNDDYQVMYDQHRQEEKSISLWTHVRSIGHRLPTAVSIGIIGGLSHFTKGASSIAQRAWTMSWLAIGSYFGSQFLEIGMFAVRRKAERPSLRSLDQIDGYAEFLPYFAYSVPAIGGFVVVSQMLKEYGVCTRLD